MGNSADTSAAASNRSLKSIARMDVFKSHGTMVFFLALIALNAFITPNFLSTGTLENTLVQVSPVCSWPWG